MKLARSSIYASAIENCRHAAPPFPAALFIRCSSSPMGNNTEQGITHFHKDRIQDAAHTQRDKSALEALSCHSFTLIRLDDHDAQYSGAGQAAHLSQRPAAIAFGRPRLRHPRLAIAATRISSHG